MNDYGYSRRGIPEHFWLIVLAIVLLVAVVALAIVLPQEQQRRIFGAMDRSVLLTATPTVFDPPTATATRTPRPSNTPTASPTRTLTPPELALAIAALLQKADAAAKQGDWPGAINALELAYDLDDSHETVIQNLYHAYVGFGDVLLKAGNQSDAIKNYREALSLIPNGEQAIAALKSLGAYQPPTPTITPAQPPPDYRPPGSRPPRTRPTRVR